VTDNEWLLRLLLRRRRNSRYALAWGLLCCLAGLLFLLLTLDGPDTTAVNTLSVLSVVLLAIGLSVMGLAALSWVFAVIGTPVRDRSEPRRLPAPPPKVRFGLLAWAVLVLVIIAAFCLYGFAAA
jgi:ABC-type nickel/cobalt efflux system permease component RcnA